MLKNKAVLWVALLLVMMMGLLAGCSRGGSSSGSTGDVEFAKTTFTALSKGDASVENSIDWENLKASGMNVGSIYKGMPDDTQRAGFRKAFIPSFSSSFQKSGASAESLTNWRVKDAAASTIVADAPNHKMLIITVSTQNGVKKIAGIEVG